MADTRIFEDRPLPRTFYARPTLDVARELVGQIIVHERSGAPLLAARIVEVEAYLGELDPASHAFRGPRGRAAIMYGPPGKLYVYFSYGMHFCMNAVAHDERHAGAVLIRAGEPVQGYERMVDNRGQSRSPARVARGPACLTAALGITKEDNGTDLVEGAVRIHRALDTPGHHICHSERIGISKAIEHPWRFFLCGHPAVSGASKMNRCRRELSS